MHLDILYKSIPYLTKEKVSCIINNYKEMKEQKRKEEEERLLMRSQQKKARGRSNSKRGRSEIDGEASHLFKNQQEGTNTGQKFQKTSLGNSKGCLGVSLQNEDELTLV